MHLILSALPWTAEIIDARKSAGAAWLLLALAGCGGGGPAQATTHGATLQSSEMVINGVSQGMSESEVRRLLGPPAATSTPFYAFMSEDSMVLWRYPGLRIEFVDHEVDRLICSGQPGACSTSNGIRVGDARARVIATYGEAERLARPFSGLLIYHHAEVPCTMTFSLRHDTVSRIEIACEEEN